MERRSCWDEGPFEQGLHRYTWVPVQNTCSSWQHGTFLAVWPTGHFFRVTLMLGAGRAVVRRSFSYTPGVAQLTKQTHTQSSFFFPRLPLTVSRRVEPQEDILRINGKALLSDINIRCLSLMCSLTYRTLLMGPQASFCTLLAITVFIWNQGVDTKNSQALWSRNLKHPLGACL